MNGACVLDGSQVCVRVRVSGPGGVRVSGGGWDLLKFLPKMLMIMVARWNMAQLTWPALF